MNGNLKKIKKITELDNYLINLDASIANKKSKILFRKVNIIEIYLHQIHQLLIKVGLIAYVLFNEIRKFRFKNLKNKKNHYQKKNKEEIFILPGEIKHKKLLGYSIMVILHIYYTDELENILNYMQNIPGEYHLCITTNNIHKKNIITEVLKNKGIVDYEISICQNRGRDIAPMFVEFQAKMDYYEYVLHIHSKKSPHDSELADWSEYLFKNLLGSRELVLSILNIFEENSQMGMIAPAHFYPLIKGNHMRWGDNYHICSKLMSEMGIDIHPDTYLEFPSGSMFWARTRALKPLSSLNLQYEDFPQERGQLDGTLAHAIERLFFYSCEISGYVWLKTKTPTIDRRGTKEINNEEIFLIQNRLLHNTANSIKTKVSSRTINNPKIAK